MLTITGQEIVRYATNISAKTPIKLYYSSKASLNKRDRISQEPWVGIFKDIGQDDVKKSTTVDCFIGFDYEKEKEDRHIVNVVKDGQETTPKESWHENFTTNGVIKRHKLTGDLYLWILGADKPSYTIYTNEKTGEEMDMLKLGRFMPKPISPPKIVVQTIKLSNIEKIKIS
jgi:hypothetical protein